MKAQRGEGGFLQRLVVAPEQIQGQTVYLTVSQQHYLRHVLRLKSGERFLVFDGKGALWMASLGRSGEQAALSPVPETAEGEQISSVRHLSITLAASLPKQGFDDVVRQGTELGVDQIVPILSDRTLLRPSLNKLERWRRIAGEAAEQAERSTVPVLRDPVSWQQWLLEETDSLRCLCIARRPAPSLLAIGLSTKSPRVVVAVGPEGGWTSTEIEQATLAGYHQVTLGKSVLRAVTASVAALSILQIGCESANIGIYQVI